MSAAYHDHFASGLLNPEIPTPQGVIATKGKGTVKRYNVYRNNVTSSLIDALAQIFPATQRIVGEEFFRDMARVFVRNAPPQSRLIFQFGEGFDDFVRGFEPAQSVPYLGDVATIERKWLNAYHAANAAPLAGDALATIPPEILGDIVLEKHPAADIFTSPFPAVSIFSANRAQTEMPKRALDDREEALIVRPHLEVLVLNIPHGHASFFAALFSGKTLGEAATLALESEPSFDIGAAIAGILQSGAFTHIKTPSRDI